MIDGDIKDAKIGTQNGSRVLLLASTSIAKLFTPCQLGKVEHETQITSDPTPSQSTHIHFTQWEPATLLRLLNKCRNISPLFKGLRKPNKRLGKICLTKD